MEVHEFMPDLSDRAPIGMTIQYEGEPEVEEWQGEEGKVHTNKDDSPKMEILKANWTEDEKQQYLAYMSGEESKREGRDILRKLEVAATQREMDEINEEVNELIRKGMKETCNVRIVRKPMKRNNTYDNNKPLFTQKCTVVKKQLCKWGKELSKPLPAFYGLKSQYRKERNDPEKNI